MKTLIFIAIFAATAQCSVIENMKAYMEKQNSAEYTPETDTDYCHGHLCPHYQVLNSTSDFEVRYYKKTTWIRSKAQGDVFGSTALHPYYGLLYYLHGYNMAQKDFNMTLPILNTFEDMDHHPITINVHFFMPESYDPIPTPLDRDVQVVSIEERIYYVRTFGHYENDFTFHNIKLEKSRLMSSLDKAGIKYNERHTYFAAYGKPGEGKAKHNEVWVSEPKRPKQSL